MPGMNKKHTITLAVATVIVVALAGLAIHKYEHRVKGLTLQQAVAQRNTANHDALVEAGIAQTNSQALANSQSQVSVLTNQKAALCAQVKAAHLVQPLCK